MFIAPRPHFYCMLYYTQSDDLRLEAYMHNYKLILSYDGSKYLGWQKQSTQPLKTIQGKLENILSILFDSPIQVIGSGRTDAGVHARMQVANFHAPHFIECTEILEYCKRYLPQDIAILKLSIASERFHSRYNALGKTYTYSIDTNMFADPFKARYSYHVGQKLNISAMQEASMHLLGTHDFKSFTSLKSKKKSTIKTIHSINFSECTDGQVLITYKGNGFLQHMVRILSGTLIEVGLGERSVDSIQELLASCKRSESGATAPSHGLCLMEVHY